MINIEIENFSNADKEYLKEFYFEIENLPQKIVDLIQQKRVKIVLTNKYSDTRSTKKLEQYKENYTTANVDETIRGNLADKEDGSAIISIFYNTTKNTIGAILYHEIGHLVDYHKFYETPSFSTDIKFIEAYKKDLELNWNKIKNDNRFRLIHFIQDSTPQNPSKLAMSETFAQCFAKSFNKTDDIDIIQEYFENCLKITKNIVDKILNNKIELIQDGIL